MLIRGIPFLAAALLLPGCQTHVAKEISADIDSQLPIVEKHMAQSSQSHDTRGHTVIMRQGAWIPADTVPINKEGAARAKYRNKHLTINRAFTDIRAVGERLTMMTGMVIDYSGLEMGELAAQDMAGAWTTSQQNTSKTTSKTPFVPTTTTSNAAVLNDQYIRFTGNLESFLNVAASRFQLSWEWTDTGVDFFKHKTQTFSVAALPGASDISSGVSDGEQRASISASNLSVWESIRSTLSNLVANGSFTVSEATGTVTVTATPEVLRQVSSFIDQQNEIISTQVVVNVQVLSIDVNNGENYGINWNVAYQHLSDRYGVSFDTATAPVDNASSLALRILENSSSNLNRRFGGSEAVIEALSTQGKVHRVTSASVTTLNNHPVPVTVGRNQNYVSSIERDVSDGVVSTSITQETIATGFMMNLLPKVISSDQLFLQFGIELSSLLGLDTISTETSTVQTPLTENRRFLQRVKIRSGQTLVIAGFEQSRSGSDDQGIGSASNTLFGGSSSADKNRSIIVVLIQPVIT